MDFQERERCEEQEMITCLNAAKVACNKFLKEKCIAPFQDARVSSEGLVQNSDLIVWGDSGKTSSAPLRVLNNRCPISPDPGVTNYKGSDLLDSLSSEDNNKSG
jgi:hypothetical protein